MKVRTLKLPRDLDQRLEQYADKHRHSRSFILREALTAYLDDAAPATGSALEMAGDLVGCLDGGPGDLSTNPKHMEGFGAGRPWPKGGAKTIRTRRTSKTARTARTARK
jgi:hypothetical protein